MSKFTLTCFDFLSVNPSPLDEVRTVKSDPRNSSLQSLDLSLLLLATGCIFKDGVPNESICLESDCLLGGALRFLWIVSLDSGEPPFGSVPGGIRFGGPDDYLATAFNLGFLSFGSDYSRFFRSGDQCLDDSVDGLDRLASIPSLWFLANATGCLYRDGLRYRVSKTV